MIASFAAQNEPMASMNREQLKKLEADLWRAANSLRANSDLKSSERNEGHEE
jgi:hypothetical protein